MDYSFRALESVEGDQSGVNSISKADLYWKGIFAILSPMKTAAAAIIALCALTAQSATLDAIVAKVNDSSITLDDVRNEIKRNPEIAGKLSAAAAGGEKAAQEIFRAGLDSLIERRLVLAQAAQKKMDMQEWVIDNRVREIVHDRFDGDMSRFEANLAESRIPLTEFRATLKEDMIIGAMRYQMVEKDLFPTPAEMKAEYDSHPERYRQAAKATLRVILVKPGKSSATLVKDIVSRLDKGESFADLAKLHSADSHARDGGLWKDVAPAEAFRPELAAAIDKLKPGERSAPISLDGWQFILLKESDAPARALPFAEAYDSVLRNVKRDIGHRLHKEWIARLRAEAYIKEYPMPDDKAK